jgi:ABC-type Mn2+/Zn2+ transport system permease subunit
VNSHSAIGLSKESCSGRGRHPAHRQLALGYALAFASYVIGLVSSAVFDLPSSPVIVWAMALIGLLVHFRGRETPKPAVQ